MSTLLFLDESGKVVLRLNGYVPPKEFEIALDYAAPGSEPGVGYREYLEEWIFGLTDHQALLEKAGADRLAAIKADPRPITVVIDGLAASAASYIAIAGDEGTEDPGLAEGVAGGDCGYGTAVLRGPSHLQCHLAEEGP